MMNNSTEYTNDCINQANEIAAVVRTLRDFAYNANVDGNDLGVIISSLFVLDRLVEAHANTLKGE